MGLLEGLDDRANWDPLQRVLGFPRSSSFFIVPSLSMYLWGFASVLAYYSPHRDSPVAFEVGKVEQMRLRVTRGFVRYGYDLFEASLPGSVVGDGGIASIVERDPGDCPVRC